MSEFWKCGMCGANIEMQDTDVTAFKEELGADMNEHDMELVRTGEHDGIQILCDTCYSFIECDSGTMQ